uniref:Glycosyltransferase family 2 protein n=1 Tax=Dictyoglomus thermophilum TaxID=14 RepID=A0A7C3RX71_DICTH
MYKNIKNSIQDQPKISIVLLNWNGWRDAVECLESLFQLNYDNYDVILVDNGSFDDSVERIKEYCEGKIKVNSNYFHYNFDNKPIKILEFSEEENIDIKDLEEIVALDLYNKRLFLIKTKENYGFDKGNNIGIQFAIRKLDPDYILIISNDVVVDRNLLTNLIKIAGKDVGLIQPKIYNYYDLSIDNLGFSCDVIGNTRPIKNLKRSKLFYLSGACLLISKDLILGIDKDGKLFDEKLYAYFEDADLSWQARLLGYDIKVCLDAICYHKGSQTTKKFNLDTFYLDYRNKLRVLIKNYSLINIIMFLSLNVLIKFLTVSFKTASSFNSGYFKSYIRALVWNIREFRDTIRQRVVIQSKRKVREREIIRYMEIIPFFI